MKKILFFVSLFVTAGLYAGQVTISRDVSGLALEHGWEQGSGTNCYLKFALDENITVYASSGNAKYLKNETEECMRYYQSSNKGEFTIRAKAGVIITSVQFDYYNSGVITNNYGTDGKSIAEANQVKTGVPFKADGNKVVLYVGCTTAATGKQVRITRYSVTYFVPEEGMVITKSAKDLGYEFGLKNNTPYQNIALNNAIKLHADNGGTLKYYTSGSLNCYRWTGAIDIVAREGVKINYVRITYNGGPRAVLTRNWGTDGKAIPAADRIASDSMLYVNADSLKLYVGDTTLLGSKSGTSPTLGITKIYVNYTDSKAIIENFSQCPVEKSETTVNVVGVDSIYNWQLTGFSREMSHHLYYEHTTQLYIGGKMVANNEEGGMKEVSFEWFASNSAQNARFAVKAGEDTLAVVDSAATGGWYPVTFTKTDIRKNGAFAIEVDATSGSQVEINHVSIIPYLRFAMREDSINAAEETTYDVSEMLIDNTEDATNIVYSIEKDGTDGAAISGSEVDLSGAKQSGAVVVKAAWEDVSARFTLNVKKNSTPTPLPTTLYPTTPCTKVLMDGQLRIYKAGKCYSVLGELIR